MYCHFEAISSFFQSPAVLNRHADRAHKAPSRSGDHVLTSATPNFMNAGMAFVIFRGIFNSK